MITNFSLYFEFLEIHLVYMIAFVQKIMLRL
jgi:hypothetical protein